MLILMKLLPTPRPKTRLVRERRSEALDVQTVGMRLNDIRHLAAFSGS